MKTLIPLLYVAISFFTLANANVICEDCTEAETTSVQLQQILDTVKTLKLIAGEADELDPKTLEYYLSKYGSKQEVAALLETLGREETSEVGSKSQSKRTKPIAKKRPPLAPKKLHKQPVGLSGLFVAHAQAENPAIGYRASAILSSNGRGVPLGIGNAFVHNSVKYKLESVTQYTNSDNSIGLSVSIRNATTDEIKSLPWKLGVKQ